MNPSMNPIKKCLQKQFFIHYYVGGNKKLTKYIPSQTLLTPHSLKTLQSCMIHAVGYSLRSKKEVLNRLFCRISSVRNDFHSVVNKKF